MNERLPICVYGTLRPGHGNAAIWEGRATARHDGETILLGYALVTCGFPYALKADAAQSVACLIVPDPDEYDAVLARMDQLEGFRPGKPSHYDRVKVVVLTPDGPTRAWLYTPGKVDARTANLPDCLTNEDGRYDFNLGSPPRYHREGTNR